MQLQSSTEITGVHASIRGQREAANMMRVQCNSDVQRF